ncbi:unnamed protein product [Blepharisma stoltei]|uniref:Uncharacterized protein n=1 Tax=Blepharisma stoltei TaxID=1481888 RepID=A0AAU9K5C9_9CILI|nr:unnamed protein product [Blepharisma stoltei]
MACIGCKDLIKRSILYTKNRDSLCKKCQKAESDQSVAVEVIEPEEKRAVRDFVPEAWKYIGRLRRYGKLISMEIGSKTYDWVQRKGRSKFKLDQKLTQLFKNSNDKDKIGLAKVTKLCYHRDYDLEQINTLLRPMGYPYDALAELFQSYYDNHIKSYLNGEVIN